MRPGLWLRLAPSTTAWLREHQIGELSARLRLAEIEGRPQSTGAVQTLLGVPLAVPRTTTTPDALDTTKALARDFYRVAQLLAAQLLAAQTPT